MADGQRAIFERDAELAAAAVATAAAMSGHGAVVLAEGPAGIGKTTLLRAACSMAPDARVLSARGLALERGFPFGIVRQLFDPVRFAAPAEWGLLLDGAARLAGRVFDGGDPGVVEDDVPYATTHGLYWLAANLAAARPLVITVDDAHWADAASLRWLSHLAARIDSLPVTLLLAARTGPDQPALLDEIRSLPSCTRLELAPLGAAGTAAMVGARLGRADETLCRSCHAATGGNPFFLESLTAELRAAPGPVEAIGPNRIATSVLRRTAQLGRGAQALTRALAVLGGPARLRLSAALAGLEVAEAALLADRLRAADVLATGSLLEFAHPIVRTAVYESLPPGERALAHLRAALLLEQDGADSERVGLHLLRTEPAGDAHVVTVLRAAAAAAAGRGAPESAAGYLRRAMAEPPDQALNTEISLELGIALATVRHPAAVPTLREAMAGSTDGTAAVVSSQLLGIWGHHDSAAAISRDALAAGLARPGGLEPATADRLRAEFFANAWTVVPELVDEAWTLAGDRLTSSGQPLWRVLGALAETFRVQPPGAALARIRPVLASGLSGVPSDSLFALFVFLTLIWTDQLEPALAACDRVLAEVRSRGSMSMVVHLSLVRSLIARRLGRLEEAAADALSTKEFKLTTSPPAAVAWMGAICLEPLTRLGRLDQAEALAAAVTATRPRDGWIHTNMFREARAELHVARQRYPEALDDLRAAAAGWRALRMHNPAAAAWRTTAVAAHLALGDHDAATKLAGEQLALARAVGTPLALGTALRAWASVTDDRAAPLEEAIAQFESVGACYDLALALADLGGWLRRAGQLTPARDPLRRALDLAEKTGAVPLRDHVRRELAAAGVRPRRAAMAGPDALTSAERQVAGLAAAGQSNKQIAQHLFITAGTVETHLRHVFQKLGITSRADIPAELAFSAASAG